MRECVLGSSLSPYTPAYDLQQACGTGLQATIAVANGIALGQYESGAAGGVDTTSDAPIAFGDDLRHVLLGLRRAKSNVDRLKLVAGCRPASASRFPPTANPAPGCRWASTPPSPRRRWASSASTRTRSPPPAIRTWPRRMTADSSTTWSARSSVSTRQQLRADSTAEKKLAKLKPVFGAKFGDATMTAGNSTPLTDGASVALLASDEWAAERELPVLAYFVDGETAAVDYVNGDDGLLMAPTYAVPRLLARNGLTLQDFDFYEIHERSRRWCSATLAAWESRSTARNDSGWTVHWAASIGRSSTSTDRRWRRDIRSPRRAAGSSRSSPSSWPRRRCKPASQCAG